MSVADGFGPAFVFHGLACLATFLLALVPSMHSMTFMALSFEASTIPLHVRRMMIMAGAGQGCAFTAVEVAFAGVFFLCRILLAWPQTHAWAVRAAAELAHPDPVGGLHPAVMVTFMFLCAGLTLLNAYWGVEILRLWCLPAGRQRASVREEPLSRKAALHAD